MRPPRIIVYPFLAAAYAVLALAAQNVHEVVWLSNLTWPILISLVVVAVVWLVSRFVIRDPDRRGLASLACAVWFAGYGYFDRFLVRQPWLYVAGPDYIAIPLFLFLLGGIAYLVARRYRGPLRDLSRYLNVTAAVLLLFPLAVLLREHGPTGRLTRADSMAAIPAAVRSRDVGAQAQPDIYLVILDKYTGTRSLARNYGFDNHLIEESLRRRGFFVPRAPRSNYIHTHLALASLLNWRLLTDRPADLSAADGALSLDYAAIEDNRTWRFLHDRGYRFVFFPSAYPATAHNRHADLQLPDPGQVTSEFEVVWRRTTLVLPVLEWWCHHVGCRRSDFPYTPAPASLIDWKFRQLAQLPDSVGPLFVLAHITVPHEPYIYDAACAHREPYWPATDSGVNEPSVKRAYIQQIQCVNRKIDALTADLLSKSTPPPIIILQADHGHGRLGREPPASSEVDPARIAERTDVFAAYYLPHQPDGVVYDSITPVNVLPRIFDYYFDAGVPPQPDATYWSTWDMPFTFERIE